MTVDRSPLDRPHDGIYLHSIVEMQKATIDGTDRS